tara:strand:+ start:2114 stop:4921 length:2808 start_codon:yes stop_codon:yes gene_type:complete
MSVQLTVFPQYFNGLQPLNLFQLEYLIDGSDFISINTSPSYTSSVPTALDDALVNQPPTIPNSFYRFRSSHNGTPSLPTESSGELVLFGASGVTQCGVYQRITNLNVGQNYDIVIDVASSAISGSFLSVAVYDGTNIVTAPLFNANSTTIPTVSFTATSQDLTLALTLVYVGSAPSAVEFNIENVSVSPQVTSPSLDDANLSNGQIILDLYEDEDIPLSLSVDDFKNVAEKVQSYSKAFKLPATKRNNKAFDNIYDITRTDDGIVFNPYIKTKCELKQDGYILFEGYLRLIDITDQNGEISYNVNLYSEAIALADFLENKTLKDINLNELRHEYNKTNIKLSWNDSSTGITYLNNNTSGFRDANSTIKYPFVDWNHQFTVDNNGNPELISLASAFRPWIQIKYLIQRIFQDSPFVFESSFFDTADFKKLYMDFNWGGEPEPHSDMATGSGQNENVAGVNAGTSFTRLRYDVETFSNSDEIGYDDSATKFTASFDNQRYQITSSFVINYTGYTTPSSYDFVGEVAWVKYSAAGTQLSQHFTQNVIAVGTGATFNTVNVSCNGTVFLNTGEFLVPSFKRFSNISTLTQVYLNNPSISWNVNANTTIQVGTSDIASETLVENLRGEIGQWEFLKGLFNMFNLIAIPDKNNPNLILIEPYGDVFINNTNSGNTSDLSLASRSIQHDWTEKIDIEEIKLTPLTNLKKKTSFVFEQDDEDYAFTQYKRATGGFAYGSKIFDASGFTILTGEEEISASPFAATILKPLDPAYPDFIVPSIYSFSADEGDTSGFDNSPRICFNMGKKTLTSCTYKIPAQNGVTGNAAEDEFLQFGHLTAVPTVVSSPPATTDTQDFNYGECQYFQGVGQTTSRNLFNQYWLPYYGELYHPDTRIMTLKVNLNAGDLATFNFFDTVFIKNREFRVNKIDYKPNDLATVEFILIP